MGPLQLSQAKFLFNHSEPSEVRGAVFLKEITGSDPAYSMDFLKSHLIMNAPLSVDHFQSSLLGGFALAPTQKWWLERVDCLSCIHNLITSKDIYNLTYKVKQLLGFCFLVKKQTTLIQLMRPREQNKSPKLPPNLP